MSRNPEVVRAFVAMDIPESSKSFLAEIQADLKRVGAGVKWVRTAGIHLTLKFLGDIRKDRIPVYAGDLEPVFSGHSPFEIRIAGLGAFPNLKRPQVIWVGFEDPSGIVVALARKVEEVFSVHGFKTEKRGFNPHLTLGRVRSDKKRRELVEAVRDRMDVCGPRVCLDHATLFQSILKPGGAEYRTLCRFPFAPDQTPLMG